MINKVGRFFLAKGVKFVWLFHMSLDGVTSIQLQNYKKAVIISLVWVNYYDLMSILEFQPSILTSTCRQS